MPPRAPLLDYIRRLAAPPDPAPESDAALLARFARDRDEAAFTAILARHGPMVLGVCRHVVGDAHAAEDCTQAAFLVLARKAASLRRPQALSAWLHGVALRVARKARSEANRRSLETLAAAPEPADPRPDPLDALTARELLALLDEEIARLPEAYRLPVLLCCREGRTQEEAARLLGWAPGSVKGRLERGRKRLHDRLTRRGLTLAAVLGAEEVSRGVALAAASGSFITTTAKAATLVAAGKAAAVAAKVAALSEGVLKAMFLTKLNTIAAVLVVLAGLGLGAHACVTAGGRHKDNESGGVKMVAAEQGEQKDAQDDAGVNEGAPKPKATPPAADPVGDLWSAYWRRQHKGVVPSSLVIDLAPDATITRSKDILILSVKITNRSTQEIVTDMAHEWHGGLWPPTDLYASVTPSKATKTAPFEPVYLAGEDGGPAKMTTIAPEKSLEVDLRMDWAGTGSVIGKPLVDASAAGTYKVRLLLVFKVKGGLQFVAGAEKAVELPPPGGRWEKLLQRKDLTPRQRTAYELIGKLHSSHLENEMGSVQIPSLDEDSKDPAVVLYRMGIDVLPMLADALDDETPTKTVIESRIVGDASKVCKVNELAALLIVRIADRDFVVRKGTKDITIREINANSALAPEFKKAVIAWYDAFVKKTPLERKIADVNDGWFRNRMDAVIWLGEHKAAAGRDVIDGWVDGFYGDKKEHPSSLTRAEMATCALALGRIGDKKSLPQVRRVCEDISDEQGQRPADYNITADLFMAYHGLSLLGAKPDAIKGLKRLLAEHRAEMEPDARKDYEKRLKEANDW